MIVDDRINIVRVPAEVDVLKVLILSDLHKGHVCHSEELLKHYLKMLDEDPYMRILGLGDFYEAKMRGSKGKPEEQFLPIREQRKRLVADLAPYADRFDIMVPGNHDERQGNEGGDSLMEVLANELGVPYYFEPIGVVTYASDKSRPCSYTIACRHGSSGGMTIGSGLNSTHKDAWNVEADIYVEAHCHKATATQPLLRAQVIEHKHRMVWRPYWLVTGGSLLDPTKSYAAMKGYPMTEPCQSILHIRMNTSNREVAVTWK